MWGGDQEPGPPLIKGEEEEGEEEVLPLTVKVPANSVIIEFDLIGKNILDRITAN